MSTLAYTKTKNDYFCKSASSVFPKKGRNSVITRYSKHPKKSTEWLFFGVRTKSIEKLFNQLAEKWEDETGLYSTTQQKINETYLNVIALGKDVVPVILKSMSEGGSAHWHTALKILTKENPVEDHELNKPKKIKQAWVNWGIDTNLI